MLQDPEHERDDLAATRSRTMKGILITCVRVCLGTGVYVRAAELWEGRKGKTLGR